MYRSPPNEFVAEIDRIGDQKSFLDFLGSFCPFTGYNAAFEMTAERWRLVREAFGAAIALDANARSAALASIPDDIRSEVESLLAAHGEAGDFLEGDAASILEGTLLGPYRVTEKIGEGGMGAVYLGYRSGEGFEQKVALKVIPAFRSSPDLDRRFVVERGILAGLEHPNIVRMLDGGEFDGGRYFAMEYVIGTPVTEHAKGLSLVERLKMFRTVCSAIHYAHRHLIVHRDIKGSNILVTAEGEVKVLDFGIAKLLDSGHEGSVTRIQPMSLDCASPEQVRGQAITTTSDVYSLGVLLYELLSGVSPQGGPGRTLDEAVKRICETTPEPPSSLDKTISRDLDSIVLRAMQKEPGLRYASADELSADIGRFLSGAPVIAQEATFQYVVRKFVGRHKLAVGAVAAGVLALATTTGAAVWQARVASAARMLAERRSVETRKLARSVIFDMQAQLSNIPGTLPVRQKMIAQTVSYLESLARDSGEDAALQIEIAGSYSRIGEMQGGQGSSNVGDIAGAMKSWGVALRLLDGVLQRDPRNLEAMRVASYVHGRLGADNGLAATPRGEEHRNQAVALARKVRDAKPGNEIAEELFAGALFAHALGIPAGAAKIAAFEETLGVYRQMLDKDPGSLNKIRNVALSAKYLANQHQQQKQFTKALELANQARELDEARLARLPGDRMATLDLTNDLGTIGQILRRLGQIQEAVRTLRRNLELRTKLAASDPGDALLRERLGKAHQSYAMALFDAGDLTSARAEYEASLEIYQPLVTSSGNGGYALEPASAIQFGLGLIAEKRQLWAEACRWFMLAKTGLDRAYSGTPPDHESLEFVKLATGKADGCAVPAKSRAARKLRIETTRGPDR